ncbi:Odontogenic ameloblast-associated protein [Fukomys damarensis]|uniref:Odontogenic ameloblast-associated protein n=1 Tax=Fukomys damarensis TaxID=885580 RepID=A0A091CW14_FUKDA|nr:Odontogenic ameloblast-associated protein [Fukomys damarensis]
MKIIIFLGLLGATLSAPGPLNSWVPPFSRRGPLQQPQAPIPALPQISLSTVDQLVGLFPNEIPFLRQVSFAQGAQTGQLDPSQPQTPSQTQQGPNPGVPGGQQQSALDPLLSRAPETVVMPAGMMPYLQNEGVNFQHDKAGVFMHSTSPKPRTANFFTTAIDPKLASELPEEKVEIIIL